MNNHVKSVQIAELMSISVAGAFKAGKTTTFDLTKGNVTGQVVNSLRTVRGPTADGQLLLELKTGNKSRFKFQLDITPTSNTYSVFMYNVEPVHKVSVPGLKYPLKLSGPALIFTGTDVFCYDGESALTALHGFILDSYPLSIFVVGLTVMLQNQFRRKSIKLPSLVNQKDLLLVTYINLVKDKLNVLEADEKNIKAAPAKSILSSNL